MMYWILFAGCLFMLFFAMLLENGRWGAPSVLIASSFTVISAMAILGLNSWNVAVADLRTSTVFAILIGCYSFLAGCVLVNAVFDYRKVNRTYTGICFEFWPSSQNNLYGMAVIGLFGSVIWYLLEARALGSFNPMELAFQLKNGVGDLESTLATGIRCLTYADCAIAFSLVGWGSSCRDWPLVRTGLLIALCSISPSAVSGIRTNVLHLAVGAFSTFFVGCRVVGRPNRIKFKTVILVFLASIALVQLFYFAVKFSGRLSYYETPLEYIEFYLAGSIPALDGFVGGMSEPTGFTETFWGLQDLAYRLGAIDTLPLKAANH